MRVVKTLFVALFVTTAVAYAQPGEVSLGVHGSLNFASSNNSDLVDASWKANNLDHGSKTGFLFGARLEAGLSDVFFLQPELNYTQKGFGLTPRAGSKVNANIDYLSTVLLAKVKFLPGSAVRPYLYAGPEFAFKVGASFTQSGTPGSVSGDMFNGFDLTANIGGGVEAQVADRVSLFTDLRYSRGLVNIINNPVAGASIKTSTLMAMVGLKMAL